MKLHAVTITAAPNADILTFRSYDWRMGDPIEDLEVCIAALQQYVSESRKTLTVALAATPPIPHV